MNEDSLLGLQFVTFLCWALSYFCICYESGSNNTGNVFEAFIYFFLKFVLGSFRPKWLRYYLYLSNSVGLWYGPIHALAIHFFKYLSSIWGGGPHSDLWMALLRSCGSMQIPNFLFLLVHGSLPTIWMLWPLLSSIPIPLEVYCKAMIPSFEDVGGSTWRRHFPGNYPLSLKMSLISDIIFSLFMLPGGVRFQSGWGITLASSWELDWYSYTMCDE